METKLCKHCQTEIPKKAKVCPNCRKKQGGIGKWIIIAIVVLFLFSLFSGGDSEKNGTNSDGTVKNEFSVGETVETSNLKISFISAEEYESDSEFMQPEEGNVYYKMEFEFENISDSDEYVSEYDFTCYADGYDMEQKYFDWMDLDATLSAGKKTKGAVFFEVPADAKEIMLEYELNFMTEDKVIFIVK